jgi:hypothetical protein
MLNPICKLSKLPRKPNLSLTRKFRLLPVTAANTRVISKKLVTAFASIWTVSLPMIIPAYNKVTLDNTPTRKELTAFARFANAVPWRLAHRENFASKAPGHVNGGSVPPTLSAHTREPLGVKTLTHNRFSFIGIYLDNKFSSTYQDFAT